MTDKPLIEKLILAHASTEKKLKILNYPTDEASTRILSPFLPLIHKTEELLKEIEVPYELPLKKHKFLYLPDLILDLLPKLHETIDVLAIITKAADATLFLVDYPTNHIYQSCQNQIDCKLNKWPIWDARTVATYAAKRKHAVIVEDVLTDPRFPDGVGYYDETIKSVLCIPVLTPDNDCFVVIQLIKYIEDPPFTDSDLKITTSLTEWIGIAIQHGQRRSNLQQQNELNEHLLYQIKRYFIENLSNETIITEIVKFAKSILNAEHGQFFIVDPETEELISFQEGIDDSGILHKKTLKIRLDQEPGIVGLVVKTGKMINIKNADDDKRFNCKIDRCSRFLTKTVLSTPMLSDDSVLGVIQITNKKNRGYFTRRDENILQIIANYSTLIVYYIQCRAETKQMFHVKNIYLKLLKRQWQPCAHDIEYFHENQAEPPLPDFNTFDYYITPDLYTEMPQLVFYMCSQLIRPIFINREKLTKFILSVRKLYRNDNSYHNFEHAFNVCHCMYNILYRNLVRFSLLETEALLIAALCHDIDHVGFTNNFLRITNDDLAQLYQESMLENHHYQITLLLLNDYEIFNNLTGDNFKLFMKEIKNNIMATDLMGHFKTRHKLLKIINEGDGFDWDESYHKQKLKAIMMNCSDLSAGSKPYSIAIKINKKLYDEFFRQGDEEKKMGRHPVSIMDRDQHIKIPEDQIQFLATIMIPCVEILKTLLPNTERMYDNAVKLRKTWLQIFETRDEKTWQQEFSFVQKQ